MTSHDTSLDPRAAGDHEHRRPVRLQLSASPGRSTLDGGWWPRSRDIDIELADLVDQFPVVIGRVDRALYSRPDWDSQPRSVHVARGRLKTGSFPGDDTHMIMLSLSTRSRLRLLVVPADQRMGEQAMALAADPSNRASASEILASCGWEKPVDQGQEHWTDDGGSWWRYEDGPPSLRRGSSR